MVVFKETTMGSSVLGCGLLPLRRGRERSMTDLGCASVGRGGCVCTSDGRGVPGLDVAHVVMLNRDCGCAHVSSDVRTAGEDTNSAWATVETGRSGRLE
jgi:hypothetical protein